jgi:hypothetical protein
MRYFLTREATTHGAAGTLKCSTKVVGDVQCLAVVYRGPSAQPSQQIAAPYVVVVRPGAPRVATTVTRVPGPPLVGRMVRCTLVLGGARRERGGTLGTVKEPVTTTW